MAYEGRENQCVGCERCFNCGRNKKYRVYSCDKCGEEIILDDYEEVNKFNGMDLCDYCYEKAEESEEE